MSIAAALGTMGLAIKTIDDDARPQFQDEQLAGMREDRDRGALNELNFAQLADKAAQEKTQRERLNAYNQLATTAKNDEDFLTQKIAKAKRTRRRRRHAGSASAVGDLKAEALRKPLTESLRLHDDRRSDRRCRNIYNTQVPDGNKVAVTPLNKTTVC